MLAKNKTDKRVVWCGSRPSLLMALEPRILYDGAAAAVIADAAVATDHLPQQDTDVAAHAATDASHDTAAAETHADNAALVSPQVTGQENVNEAASKDGVSAETNATSPGLSDTSVTDQAGSLSLDTTGTDKSATISQIVLVDTSVSGYEKLVDGIIHSTDNDLTDVNPTGAIGSSVYTVSGSTLVVELGDHFFDDVGEILSNYSDLSAIHLVSHGDQGELILNGQTINEANLGEYSTFFTEIGSSLSDSGDLLLYGCEVGKDGAGQSFVDAVADLTHADVNASDDSTGNADSHGDWDLEVATGSIETSVLLNERNAADWDGLLETPKEVVDHLVLNGSATRTDDTTVQLTPDVTGQSGSAMSDVQIDLTDDFNMTFDIYLGTKDGDGADGIAFILQNDPRGSTATGGFGIGMGCAGIQNGIAIDFDTYWNNYTYEGSDTNVDVDHTAVWDTDDTNNSTKFLSNSSATSHIYALPNLEDGAWHSVAVSWDASAQSLTYTLDGVTYPTLVVNKATYFGSDMVYFGFTSGTGSLSNQQSIRITSYDGTLVDPSGPVVDLNSTPETTAGANRDYNTTFTEGGSAVAIANRTDSGSGVASISDSDSTTLSKAEIILTNAQTGDSLSVNGSTATSGTYSGLSWTHTGDTISVSGSGTLATYAALIRSITFQNSSEAPNTTTRDITVQTWDDTDLASNTAHAYVAVRAVNDAPVAHMDVVVTVPGETKNIDVRTNDVDVDGDALTVVEIFDETASSTAIPIAVGGTVTLASGTTVTLMSDGTLNVTMSKGVSEQEAFYYTVSDGNGGTCRATVELKRDSDGDGVANMDDIDDDNDGILDINEGQTYVFTTSIENPVSGNLHNNYYSGAVTNDFLAANPGLVISGSADANIIGVGASGGYNAAGPDFAQDGTQYLDLAGNGTLRYNFTVTEDSLLDVSAWFSRREAASGTACIDILDASGAVIYSSVTDNLAGASRNEWCLSQLSAKSIAAGTYTFQLYLDNNLNLDNIKIALSRDSDGDGIADHLDIDSDNDGITDNIEAQATKEYIAPSGTGAAMVDADGDGLDDNYDANTTDKSTSASVGLMQVDTDSDGTVDVLDADSDNDGKTDIIERGDGQPSLIASTTDTDFDGLLDIFESGTINDRFVVNDNNWSGGVFNLARDINLNADGSNADPLHRDLLFRDVNNPPVAVDDAWTTEVNTPIAIDLLPNDSDVDGDTLTVETINGVAITHGTPQDITVPDGVVHVAADGSLTFTPGHDVVGIIRFPYSISDGNGGTATAMVYIVIKTTPVVTEDPLPDPPDKVVPPTTKPKTPTTPSVTQGEPSLPPAFGSTGLHVLDNPPGLQFSLARQQAENLAGMPETAVTERALSPDSTLDLDSGLDQLLGTNISQYIHDTVNHTWERVERWYGTGTPGTEQLRYEVLGGAQDEFNGFTSPMEAKLLDNLNQLLDTVMGEDSGSQEAFLISPALTQSRTLQNQLSRADKLNRDLAEFTEMFTR